LNHLSYILDLFIALKALAFTLALTEFQNFIKVLGKSERAAMHAQSRNSLSMQ